MKYLIINMKYSILEIKFLIAKINQKIKYNNFLIIGEKQI